MLMEVGGAKALLLLLGVVLARANGPLVGVVIVGGVKCIVLIGVGGAKALLQLLLLSMFSVTRANRPRVGMIVGGVVSMRIDGRVHEITAMHGRG